MPCGTPIAGALSGLRNDDPEGPRGKPRLVRDDYTQTRSRTVEPVKQLAWRDDLDCWIADVE